MKYKKTVKAGLFSETFCAFFDGETVRPPPPSPPPADSKIEKLKRVIADPSATKHEKATARRLIARLEKSSGP